MFIKSPHDSNIIAGIPKPLLEGIYHLSSVVINAILLCDDKERMNRIILHASLIILLALEGEIDAACIIATLLAAAMPLAAISSAPRSTYKFPSHLNYDDFLEMHELRHEFKAHLRMSVHLFKVLLNLICHNIQVDRGMAALCGLALYATIRWLSGALYSDISYHIVISKASFYCIVWKTIHAINRCKELDLQFPTTELECQELALGFQNFVTEGAIDGCIGGLDGWLLWIPTPSSCNVGNVCSFFNGHYQCYGLNVQAVSDHHCHFLYMAVLGPGVMNDNQAYQQKVRGTSLKDLIESLPNGYYVISDAAYTPSKKVLLNYGGMEAQKP